MDCIDRAQDREAFDRELALEAQRRRGSAGAQACSGICVDCDEPIAPARLAALGSTLRCVDCARDHEHRQHQRGIR